MKFCITPLLLLSSLAIGSTIDKNQAPISGLNVRDDVGHCQDACATFVNGYDLRKPQQTTTEIRNDDAAFYRAWLMSSMCNQMLTTSAFATETTDIHATPTNNITSYSNLMRLWTPGNTFPPFPTACIGSVSHQIDEAEIWEQAFRSACSCGGWTATTVTAFMPDPTLTEPVEPMAARELPTSLIHSRGPLQTKHATIHFPLDARDGTTCNDECANALEYANAKHTWAQDHSIYTSLCTNFMVTTVMPVAAITTGRPITTKATYNATTTFAPSLFPSWDGWRGLVDCDDYKAIDPVEKDVDKMKKALSSACSCAGITPAITTVTKPVQLQTPAPLPYVPFDGLFKLRAHFQDSGNASWLVCTPDIGRGASHNRDCSFEDDETRATYYHLEYNWMSIVEWSDIRHVAAGFGLLIAQIPGGDIASSKDPEVFIFGELPEDNGPDAVSLFVEKEVKEKEGSVYVLKAGGGHFTPETPNLEFVSCQEKICLATRQWALDFARGDLSEYSKSTLEDYRLLTLEVVPVTEAVLGPPPSGGN